MRAKPPQSASAKILLGIGSWLSLIAIPIIVVFVLAADRILALVGDRIMVAFLGVWVLGFLSFGVGIAIGIYYILLVFASDASESQRQFWVYVLLMLFPVAGPIFWYRVIWRGLPISAATELA